MRTSVLSGSEIKGAFAVGVVQYLLKNKNIHAICRWVLPQVVFSLLTNMFAFMLDRIESQNIKIGKFVASNQKAIINFYYTPTVLTTDSLVFDKDKMTTWWQSGFNYALYKDEQVSPLETE